MPDRIIKSIKRSLLEQKVAADFRLWPAVTRWPCPSSSRGLSIFYSI